MCVCVDCVFTVTCVCGGGGPVHYGINKGESLFRLNVMIKKKIAKDAFLFVCLFPGWSLSASFVLYRFTRDVKPLRKDKKTESL